MANYYYLVSSLPSLELEERPFLSLDKFIESCADWLDDADLKLLDLVSLVPDEQCCCPTDSAVCRWNQWETCFRNKVAKVRGSKLNKDISEFVRHEDDFFSEIDRFAQDATAAKNPLEAEKLMDQSRWKALDNLEACHEFDIDKLCVYKLKLMLCEKWTQRDQTIGRENFGKIVDAVYSA